MDVQIQPVLVFETINYEITGDEAMDRKGIAELLWVFKGNYCAGSHVKRHAHLHHYNLIFIEKGSAEFELGGSVFEPIENECLLIPPGTKHSVISVSEKGMCTIDIKFVTVDTALKRILCALPLRLTTDMLTRGLIMAILDASNSPVHDVLNIHASNSFLLSLLFHLGAPDALLNAKHGFSLPDEYDSMAFSPVTQKAMQFLQNHYGIDATLGDLAKELNYNKNYICGVFKKETGQTVNDFLTQIRVRKAEELLVFSHYPLTQIAQSTGFNSLSHFIRTFKKKMGLPPGVYRRTYSFDDMLEDLGDIPLSNEFVKSLMSKKVLRIERTGGKTALVNEGSGALAR